MTTAKIELPPKLIPLFSKPRGSLRMRGAYGGRGSGKSFTFAKMAAVWGYVEPLRILGTRELQISIKESFHAEVKNAILSTPWLAAHYEVGENFIRGKNGTEFIFRGLKHNMSAIKSMAQIDLCIVEEAADVPESSWRDLLPTIRAPKSEVWVIWNPKNENDPVEQFRNNPPPRSMFVELNYMDNPWFPNELEEQRRHAQTVLDPNTYSHIWEGQYLVNSDSQVFHGKIHVDEFEPQPDWNGPYYGLDFGFSADPTTANEVWVYNGDVYIRREANKVGLELDDTSRFISTKIPGIEKHTIRADSARPESISYLRRSGLPRIEGVKKWPGSVEDGIQHLRAYGRIVIHPECRETIRESRLYSYKVDKLTGDIKPDIVDAHNHHWDAIRYALQPLIKQSGFVFSC